MNHPKCEKIDLTKDEVSFIIKALTSYNDEDDKEKILSHSQQGTLILRFKHMEKIYG